MAGHNLPNNWGEAHFAWNEVLDPNQAIFEASQKPEPGVAWWNPGDVIRTDACVRTNQLGVLCVKVLTEEGHVDEIYNMPETDYPKLSTLGMANFNGDFKVTSKGEKLSEMREITYGAELLRVNIIEKPWDGERSLSQGEYVLIQGEVTAFDRGLFNQGGMRVTPGTIAVRLDSGRVCEANLHARSLHLTGGSLDIRYPSSPRPGDIIQARVHVDNEGLQKSGQPQPLEIMPDTFLLRPNPDREAAYNTRVSDVSQRLENLSMLEGSDFRLAFVDLLRAHIDIEHRPLTTYWKLLISPPHMQQLQELRRTILPDSVDGLRHPEGLVLDTNRWSNLRKLLILERHYATDILSMSPKQYYDFCDALAMHQHDLHPQPRSGPYADILTHLYHIYPSAELLALYQRGLMSRLDLLMRAPDSPSFVSSESSGLTHGEDRFLREIMFGLGKLSKRSEQAQTYVEAILPSLHQSWRDVLIIARDSFIDLA